MDLHFQLPCSARSSQSLYVDTSHLSRIAPCEDATAFGVTGMLLALITTLDFLSGVFFFDLDVS